MSAATAPSRSTATTSPRRRALTWKDGEEVRTAAATISARGANLLVIDWPAEFSGIADGTEVTFTVTKTADGKEYAVNATAVVAG